MAGSGEGVYIPHVWIQMVEEARYGWLLYHAEFDCLLEVDNIFEALVLRDEGWVNIGRV